jgi:hypothetical protein
MDASYSLYPTKVCCPKCSTVAITKVKLENGTASWCWCVLLSPFVGLGFLCLCFDSCKDRIHFCSRCGEVVGRKFAEAC